VVKQIGEKITVLCGGDAETGEAIGRMRRDRGLLVMRYCEGGVAAPSRASISVSLLRSNREVGLLSADVRCAISALGAAQRQNNESEINVMAISASKASDSNSTVECWAPN